ncbi:hypothetical protein HP9810_603g1 [Helicobacter pylori 98-10]|nr:hypothetical protein HP9810_603g1 [Helicobacter pylori 98-10]
MLYLLFLSAKMSDGVV